MSSDKMALALQRANWWIDFINGDIDTAASHLAPDVVRIGCVERNANHVMSGRDYLDYLRAVWPTQPKINTSVVHDITISDDGRWTYLTATEVDSWEPGSTEKTIAVEVMIASQINDAGLVSMVDVYWKEPERQYEWTGTVKQ